MTTSSTWAAFMYPDIPAYETYDELFAAIQKVIEG